MQKLLQWLEKVLMTPMAKASEQRHLLPFVMVLLQRYH